MLELAERLRLANGGRLDEEAVQAVAEATGHSVEMVRMALKLRAERGEKANIESFRDQYLALDPSVRRFVSTGVAAVMAAFLHVLENRVGGPSAHYGIFDMLALVVAAVGVYNVGTARDARQAGVAGAILAGGYFAANSLFLLILRMPADVAAFVLVPVMGLGGAIGVFFHRFVDRFRPQLGLGDPVDERRVLLRQLVDIQERLRADEESATFLSVDIVGSTRMKEAADPLSVEFTFNEYHAFVERLVRAQGGRVHSTAGDGVTAAFDHPQQAFAAARTIQTGLIELNTFRNRIGQPIVLRQSVHTGSVMVAEGADITTVNFARVIDVAAHLQKIAEPGTVAISDDAAVHLPGGLPEGRRIQAGEVGATLWSPRTALAAGGPPPPP